VFAVRVFAVRVVTMVLSVSRQPAGPWPCVLRIERCSPKGSSS
jgi:hypothetical protein